MTLEATIQDKAKIPEGLADHYVETDGVFVLAVNGLKSQKDFDDYAEALKKRLTDAGADLARKHGTGLGRDDVVEIIEGALKKFVKPGATPGKGNGTDGGDDGQGDVSARLHDLERNLASVTKELEKSNKERDDALGKSKDTTIRNQLTQAANSAGATPEGVSNLVSLIERNFEVAQDGSVVTKLEAGPGVSPNQKPEDFLASTARDKAFRMFWPKSVGAGADCVLTGHGVNDQQRLDGTGGLLDVLKLPHQVVVDGEAASGIENQVEGVVFSGLLYGVSGDLHRRGSVGVFRVDRHVYLFAQLD